jgi:hypothetical protein
VESKKPKLMVEVHIDREFINQLSSSLVYREGLSPETVYQSWEILMVITNQAIELKSSYKIYPSELKEWILKNAGKDIALPEYIPNFQEASPFAFYFLNSADVKTLRKKRLPVYSHSDCTKQFGKLFKSELQNAKDFISWGMLAERLLPFDSIIIADNYLFSNNGSSVFDFFEAVFKNVNKDATYFILIQTSTKYGSPLYSLDAEHLREVLEEKLSKAEAVLSKTGLKSFHVCIVVNNRYHDRHIFTNTQILKSSNSFSTYFDSDSTLDISSNISDNSGKPMLEKFIKRLATIKSRFSSNNAVIVGSRELLPILKRIPKSSYR